MTWNPPPFFSENDTPTLAEWNRYITSLDAITTRFDPTTATFKTQHNCFARYVSSSNFAASHIVPLPITPVIGSFVGALVLVFASSGYDVRLEGFYWTGASVGSSYTLTFGTVSYVVSSNGEFSISCTVPIQYGALSIVILP